MDTDKFIVMCCVCKKLKEDSGPTALWVDKPPANSKISHSYCAVCKLDALKEWGLLTGYVYQAIAELIEVHNTLNPEDIALIYEHAQRVERDQHLTVFTDEQVFNINRVYEEYLYEREGGE